MHYDNLQMLMTMFWSWSREDTHTLFGGAGAVRDGAPAPKMMCNIDRLLKKCPKCITISYRCFFYSYQHAFKH
jgi:hypothetical protein